MSIPESVARAASIYSEQDEGGVSHKINAETRARRVILALAEEMPDDAVEKAVQTWLESASDYTRLKESGRAAIAAFLKHVAGDSL
jgi:hypothetical protein